MRRGSMLLAFLVLLLAGCATAGAGVPGGTVLTPSKTDPWEPMNRAVFSFNEGVDAVLLKPAARTYEAVIPELYRGMVGNFFANIGDLWSAVNQLLQGKPALAGADLARVVINSTIGFGGVADAATSFGVERHTEDFGQTLGRWGVTPGPYVVLPLLGPSNVRDTLGWAADIETDPLVMISKMDVRNSVYGLRFVDKRASLLSGERVLEGAVLDKYSFVRDAYLQRRRNLVYDGEPPDTDEDDLDDGLDADTPAAAQPK